MLNVRLRFKAGAIGLLTVALGTLASGCSSPSQAPVELEATQFSVDGVAIADFEAGQAVVQKDIETCLGKKGFRVALPAPRLMSTSAVTGDGPATAAINELKSPNPYQIGADPRDESGQPGLLEASQGCQQAALQAQYSRMGKVKSVADRLTGEWQAFEQGSTYKAALSGFSACMTKAGHPAHNPEEVGNELTPAITTAVNALGPSASTAERTKAIEAFLPQEATLRQVGTTCWDEHLKQPLAEYRAQLWQKYPDDLKAYQAAVRNEG